MREIRESGSTTVDHWCELAQQKLIGWHPAPIGAANEGYSGHSVKLQADHCGNGFRECLDWAPVVGVHSPPGLEVRDYLLDDPADLVHLAVELLLPV